MILTAEALIIGVLLIALIILVVEEAGAKRSRVPTGTVKEYWDGRERRRALRVGAALSVRYYVEQKPAARLSAFSKDISSGGMRLLVNEKLPQGTLLLLEFELPDTKKTIGAEAKVVWGEGRFNERDAAGRRVFHTGIQFVTIKQEDKDRLVEYIEKNTDEGKKKA